MLSHPQDFHTSILAAWRIGLLGQKEGISVLWEEMRRLYITSLYSRVATISISLPLPISMFGLPRVNGEKSWEKPPRKDGRCLCCKCPLQSEALSKYIPVVPHDLWPEVGVFEFLCSGVSIHRGGQHPATVSACFDISCGMCWEILFLLRLRAMGSPSELGLNPCSTDYDGGL